MPDELPVERTIGESTISRDDIPSTHGSARELSPHPTSLRFVVVRAKGQHGSGTRVDSPPPPPHNE